MTTGEKIIAKAKEYKGERGGFVWDYWPGLGRGQSWCVGFVLFILYKCGLKKEIYKPSSVSLPFWLPTIEEWLHKNATHVKMADAQPGDIVIFTWTGGGNNSRRKGVCSRDHIGFIRKKGTSQTAYTIEGNTSGGIVDERTRDLTNIFAIYRLDCCKAGKSSKKEQKAAKKAEKAAQAKRKAVDISAWQGKLTKANFKDVKAAGYDTVILRCGYTSQGSFTLNTDKVFEHNIKTAHQVGMKIGIYWYSQAISKKEAAREAGKTILVIQKFKAYITEPVAFDWEFGGRLSAGKARSIGKDGCTAICKAYCNAIKEAGYDTMVYANYSTLTSYLNNAALQKLFKIWLAHYASKTGYKGYYLWQYSSSGSVPGIHGKVDVNVYAEDAKTPQNGKNGYSGAFPDDYVSTTHYTVKNARRWQNFLNWYFGREVVTADGIFGPRTKAWTKEFQKKVFATSTEWDGIAGTKTIKKAKAVTK